MNSYGTWNKYSDSFCDSDEIIFTYKHGFLSVNINGISYEKFPVMKQCMNPSIDYPYPDEACFEIEILE
jgi:hypothetical protein